MQSRFQEMLKAQRQNAETARVGLKWEKDELEQLMKMINNGQSTLDVAKTLQRTEGSIRTRLILNAVSKMDDEGYTIQKASEYVKIPVEEIKEHIDKKNLRMEKKKRKPISNNTEIYNLLMTVNKKLDTLMTVRASA